MVDADYCLSLNRRVGESEMNYAVRVMLSTFHQNNLMATNGNKSSTDFAIGYLSEFDKIVKDQRISYRLLFQQPGMKTIDNAEAAVTFNLKTLLFFKQYRFVSL